MKFLKYLGISIAAIIVLFLISFVITLASSESTEETIELERITITEPTKSFMEVELKSPGKDPYIVGKCNFPDSTKLSLTIFKGESAIIGGADWTNSGKFVFSLKENIVNADSIKLSCIKHENFHSPNVLKQLQLVDSGIFVIKYKYSMNDLYRESFRRLLEYEAPRELDMSTVKKEDWTQKDWRRINFVVNSKKKYKRSEAINQLKHLLIEELVKHPTLTAVGADYNCDSLIRATDGDYGKDWFIRAVFAPHGDWTCEKYKNYYDYKFLIKDEY